MVTNDDLILLNAYIDGELSAVERSRLEGRLQNEPALAAELAELQQVVALVQQMPLLKAPRSFALHPDSFMATRPMHAVEPSRPPARHNPPVPPQSFPNKVLFPWRRLLMGAAAMLLVLMCVVALGLGLLRSPDDPGNQETQVAQGLIITEPVSQPEVAAVPSNVALPSTTPPDSADEDSEAGRDEATLQDDAGGTVSSFSLPAPGQFPPDDPFNPMPPAGTASPALVLPPSESGQGGAGGGMEGGAGGAGDVPPMPPLEGQPAADEVEAASRLDATETANLGEMESAEVMESADQTLMQQDAPPSGLRIQQALERLVRLLQLFLIGRSP